MWSYPFGLLSGGLGMLAWSVAAGFWFVMAVIAAVLVVLLARFLWFGTRAAKVYLEEHGQQSGFTLFEGGSTTDAPHPAAPTTPPVPASAPAAFGDDQPTMQYPAGGWPESSEVVGQEQYAADGALPAWPPAADAPTERLDSPGPGTAPQADSDGAFETPPAGVADAAGQSSGPQPRTPLRPRTASRSDADAAADRDGSVD